MSYKLRRPFLGIALWAVLLHALLPFVHAATGPSGVATTLCSAAGNGGLVFVAAGGDIGDPPPLLQGIKCPLCLGGTPPALGSAPPLSFASPTRLAHVQVAATEGPPRPRRAILPFSPRAPPRV